jgi:glucose-1-phosphate cytidylyltransferase
MSNPKVVILCGGLGTRLREETEFKPKPLVEIGGRPILWHIMKGYAHHGYRDFILCLGYRGHMIKEYFLSYECMNHDFLLDLRTNERRVLRRNHGDDDWRIIFADTGHETNTGGRIQRIRQYIDTDYFFATYGDGVSDVDIRDLEAFFLARGRTAVITGLHPWSKYGRVDVGVDGIVTGFAEKPQLRDVINGGFFVFSRRVFDYLDADCVLEREPFERLAKDQEIALYKHDGFWHAMDTYKDYLELNRMWNSGSPPWRVWDR